MTVALEICVEGPAGARAALTGGADRVELCSALPLGGLTPSPGLVAATVAAGLPVHAMIRPVAGDFVHDAALVACIADDIRTLARLGIAGVVVGALTGDRRLDRDALARWREAAAGLVMTLHRAVDLCASPVEAVEEAAAIGIDRVLTSGAAPTAVEGAATIAAMTAVAGAMEVMAGSGVRADNVRGLIGATGVSSIHASAATDRPWTDPRIGAFGFGGAAERRTCVTAVRALRTAMDQP